MATTAISSGRLVRRTAPMSPSRAKAFVKMLGAQKRDPVQLAIIVTDGAKTRVEFVPASGQAQSRMFEEIQARRILRSLDVRAYQWRRMPWHRAAWKCRGPEGQEYVVRLNPPSCECADWPTISSVGGRCKHYFSALEAERRYQEHLRKGKEESSGT